MLVAMIALELCIGGGYAAFLTFTRLGRHIAQRVTWFSVVVGVAFTLLLLIPVIGAETVGIVFLGFAASSTGVIVRSLSHDADQDDQRWAKVQRRDDGDTQ